MTPSKSALLCRSGSFRSNRGADPGLTPRTQGAGSPRAGCHMPVGPTALCDSSRRASSSRTSSPSSRSQGRCSGLPPSPRRSSHQRNGAQRPDPFACTGPQATPARHRWQSGRPACRSRRQVLVERHTLEPTTSLLILSRAGGIHEHPPHEPSRHREKVRAILPPDATNINEPEVDLVDERRGLENVARTFASHLPLCQTAQFLVHEREQLLQGSGVAVPPLDQQGCYVAQRSRGPSPVRSRPATGPSLEPPPLWVLRSDTARPFYAPP